MHKEVGSKNRIVSTPSAKLYKNLINSQAKATIVFFYTDSTLFWYFYFLLFLLLILPSFFKEDSPKCYLPQITLLNWVYRDDPIPFACD